MIGEQRIVQHGELVLAGRVIRTETILVYAPNEHGGLDLVSIGPRRVVRARRRWLGLPRVSGGGSLDANR